MIPFTIVAALSYIIPAAIVGNFVGAEFVDLIGCVICLIVLVVLQRKAAYNRSCLYDRSQ